MDLINPILNEEGFANSLTYNRIVRFTNAERLVIEIIIQPISTTSNNSIHHYPSNSVNYIPFITTTTCSNDNSNKNNSSENITPNTILSSSKSLSYRYNGDDEESDIIIDYDDIDYNQEVRTRGNSLASELNVHNERIVLVNSGIGNSGNIGNNNNYYKNKNNKNNNNFGNDNNNNSNSNNNNNNEENRNKMNITIKFKIIK
ncbi:hypothetical protein ACTA71_005455 [Dictyostelium dimigraforme]